jgi:hypothetical protein
MDGLRELPIWGPSSRQSIVVLCKTHWNFLARKLAFRAHILIPPFHDQCISTNGRRSTLV